MFKNKFWQPISKKNWNAETARHLASRIGFNFHPDTVEEYQALGATGVVEKYLLSPSELPEPNSVLSMEEFQRDFREQRDTDKRTARQLLQKRNRESYTDFALAWYDFARDETNSPQEKLTLFFQNVWVVSFQGVKSTPNIFDYQAEIRSSLTSNYPDMCQKLSLTPAMCKYLDINKNQKDAPNENFARELFELFILGEGNYSEEDVKEAARSLTGYKIGKAGKVVLRAKAHDNGTKRVFGETGRFTLEDIIRIAFKQSAASTFLPREFCQYYLSDEPLPSKVIEELGDMWKKANFSLPFLYQTVFSSRIFYDEKYRANMIKSPVHFYIGLHQDFELDLVPLPRASVRQLRSMGQPFFNPPNVRGWVGGKNWINSATIAARSQVVEFALNPLNTKRLNADETAAIEKSKSKGNDHFQIDAANIARQAKSTRELVRNLTTRLYPSNDDRLLQELAESLFEPGKNPTEAKVRELLFSALSLPDYHLC